MQVLAPFEILEQPESVCGPVFPAAGVALAFDEGAEGAFPIEPGRDVVALQEIPAGQPQESRVQGAHHLHQIRAVAVGAVAKGGREQRDEVDPNGAARGGDDEAVIDRRRQISRRGQRGLEAFPGVGQGPNLGGGPDVLAIGAGEADGERGPSQAPRVEAGAVRRRGPQGDAPIAVVGHAGGALQTQARGRGRTERLGVIQCHLCVLAAGQLRPMHGVVGVVEEDPVLD